MLGYTVFTEKELRKDRKKLVELHKRVIKTYLVSLGVRSIIIRKFFKLYDCYIDERNILSYFYVKTSILVNALVKGDEYLLKVRKYIFPKKNKKRKRKKI